MTHSFASRDRRVLWHPFTQHQEWARERIVTIESGHGVTLTDTDGNRYLDGVSSLWCNVHGHRVPEIDRAIRLQLRRLAHSTFLGLTHRPGIELAERLVAIAPRGLRRVFFSDSGSEAMEIALKIAFQYWVLKGKPKKKKFITFSGAYHGDTVGAVSLGGIDLFHRTYGPLLFKTIRVPSTYAYRWPGRPSLEECGRRVLERVREILRKRSSEIAAVVTEPRIQGAAGMITQPPGFVRALRTLTRRYGVLLIADEVATGFGRTGTMFAVESEGVAPDIMALAKGLTGGYLPLAATLTTERIFRAFSGSFERTFFHGHTYTANPLACAAALASLRLFDRRRTLQTLPPKIDAFQAALKELGASRWVGEIRQVGLMAGAELVSDRESRKPFPPHWRVGRAVCLRARRYGVLLRPLGDVLVFMPPPAMTVQQIRQVVRAAKQGLRDWEKLDLPRRMRPSKAADSRKVETG